MPQIPQIGDSTGKSYSTTLGNNRSSGGEQQFTVDGTPKPEQLQAVSEKNAGGNAQTTMGQKDLIPLAVTVSKNQALAVETIKDIINADLLGTAKLNGYTELAGELENLSNSLYIPAGRLLEEMLEQENQNTMFINDRFYDLLRELSADANPDLKEAIGNMLKAINFSQNRDEITSALASNLKFLAEYFSPNRALSENLSQLAVRWFSGEAETNFAALRNQTSELLKNVSDSLLNDSHTQTLLPIVIHNISKYNTNDSMLREYFGQLLTQIPSYEMRNELANAFESLLAKLANRQLGSLPEERQENSGVYSANREMPKSVYANRADIPERSGGNRAEALPKGFVGSRAEIPPDRFGEGRAEVLPERFGGSRADTLPEGSGEGRAQAAPEGLAGGRTEVPPDAQETPFSNYTINEEKNQVENSFFGKENSIFSKENGNFEIFSDYLNKTLTNETFLSETGLADPDFTEYITALHRGTENGREVVARLLSELVPDAELQNAVSQQIRNAGSMQELVNLLNSFLEAMPEGTLRDSVYEALDEAISVLAEEQSFPQAGEPESQPRPPQEGRPSSSIQALTDFVAKNINHPALKSIDSFNASNLLQSMINAPGVMTPLSHFILPIQIEDTRAFGELWVDNDDDSGVTGGGQKHYHMFLTFDVDAFGRFEADVYANENTVNISLMHPPSFGKNIEQVIERIHRIAAGSGYTVNRFETGVLRAPHNLSQIFPKLIERRAGLNVQA